jgi:hypothetical protein
MKINDIGSLYEILYDFFKVIKFSYNELVDLLNFPKYFGISRMILKS